jgi:hypothetical protein
MNGKIYILIKRRLMQDTFGEPHEFTPSGIIMDLANSVANDFPSFFRVEMMNRVIDGVNR